MVKKLNANGKAVYEFVLEHEEEGITSNDIAEATGIAKKSVDGIVTMTFCRNTVKGEDDEKISVPLMERVPAEIEEADGSHSKVKFIKLTDEGRAIEIEDKD